MTALRLSVPDAEPLTGKQTAKKVGLSWDRFRKVRERWTRDRDFPAEINEPGEAVRYDAAAVDAWLDRRSRRVHAPPPPVVRTPGDRPDHHRAAAGRAALRQIMGGAA